jgi:glyoxylase-like metal-dependent hydrolase (beta-lactamase superfamily II)
VSVVAFTGTEGVLLVDAAYQNTAPLLKEKLRETGNDTIRYLINTHWHSDHTGGNPAMDEDVIIIAHEYTAGLLEHDQQILGRDRPALPVHALPDILFNDRLSIRFNGKEIQLMYLPGGHTGGDVIVYFPFAHVLTMGDLCFADRFPFVDLEHGGNAVTYAGNLEWITQNFPAGTRIVCGHGRIFTMKDLISYTVMLRQTIAIVRDLTESGQPVEVIRGRLLENGYGSYGEGWITTDAWIETVIKSL